ncbi:hypothetical protein PoMZ_07936 [Pyricularia oryzae]|uniref:Uncharacterized protein n=1 Tax=Pyricularia oryzae TaxID=318829 RepID=A0A4P7NGH6_PYROR|nr:hypothetical protein PoMZ_07936 [Pyricularia oryzae]
MHRKGLEALAVPILYGGANPRNAAFSGIVYEVMSCVHYAYPVMAAECNESPVACVRNLWHAKKKGKEAGVTF